MVIKKTLKEYEDEIKDLNSLLWNKDDNKDLHKLRELLAGQTITEILAELDYQRQSFQNLNFELTKKDIIIKKQEKELQSKNETINALEGRIKEQEKVTRLNFHDLKETKEAAKVKQIYLEELTNPLPFIIEASFSNEQVEDYLYVIEFL
ncbi:485_t:CDS:2 [Funneliformis geosporum]|uniref:485_t:CDS:1 n=1 Tax=Funneliformis geosporum TaxID=1117311 RepID=A0A9W4SR05_9GLOM|nr:485_t:CDS:2 [Funneliformis geosporum]